MCRPIVRNAMRRLGWTGDAQAFSRTAGYNMNVHNFFSKWLKDLAADQAADGVVPLVIPNVLDPPMADLRDGRMHPPSFRGICGLRMVIQKYWRNSTPV